MLVAVRLVFTADFAHALRDIIADVQAFRADDLRFFESFPSLAVVEKRRTRRHRTTLGICSSFHSQIALYAEGDSPERV